MCNRARAPGDADFLFSQFRLNWATLRPMDNRFNPAELVPKSRAHVIRQDERGRGVDVMGWDVLSGAASWPMTNVRNLRLPQWKALASNAEKRCLIPVMEFAEWAPSPIDLGDGKKPIKGEMWFAVPDQPVFAIAGFWQEIVGERFFAMVTCDANELVAPIHPKAMVTIVDPENYDHWLTCDYDEALTLQRPYPAERMTVRGPDFPTRGIRDPRPPRGLAEV